MKKCEKTNIYFLKMYKIFVDIFIIFLEINEYINRPTISFLKYIWFILTILSLFDNYS